MKDIGSVETSGIVLSVSVLSSVEPEPASVPLLSPMATSALSSGPSKKKLPTSVVTLIWPLDILQSK